MALLPASESVRDLFRSLGEPGSYGSGTAGPAACKHPPLPSLCLAGPVAQAGRVSRCSLG